MKFDTDYKTNIVCPHCGYVDRDPWDVDFGPGVEGDAVIDCSDCGKSMSVQKTATIKYSSKKAD